MPGIEYQSDQIRIGHVKKMRDLLRRLDITGAVVMEGRRQAGRITHRARNAFGATGECFPLGLAEAHLRCDTPGVPRAHGVGAIGIGENKQRALNLYAGIHSCCQ